MKVLVPLFAVMILRVYSIDHCPPCHVLLSAIKNTGAKIQTTVTSQDPGVPGYPAVIYDNGTCDGGQQFYDGRAKAPKTVRVTKYVP